MWACPGTVGVLTNGVTGQLLHAREAPVVALLAVVDQRECASTMVAEQVVAGKIPCLVTAPANGHPTNQMDGGESIRCPTTTDGALVVATATVNRIMQEQ
jgi:hypothetical protein